MKKITLRLEEHLLSTIKLHNPYKSINEYVQALILADIENYKINLEVKNKMNMKRIKELIIMMREIQLDFLNKYHVDDIWSNSKIFEITIANSLNHILIPGHSGSKDAKDLNNNQFEYKHYKETSSNHSWTFNDFSDDTIASLKNVQSVIFAHINDSDFAAPGKFDWYYEVPGHIMSDYLTKYTANIRNTRKMINVSPKQIESRLGIIKTYVSDNFSENLYSNHLREIINIIQELEEITKTKNLLTSNKFWELLVALELDHTVNSEQGGREGAHDAYDNFGRTYEYKVSKNHSWNFQDISDNVLNKYYNDEAIILAVVDKTSIKVTNIYTASPNLVVPRLKEKLNSKISKKALSGETIRRLQVSLSKSDLKLVQAKAIL